MAKQKKEESAINAQVSELTAEQLESLPEVDNTGKEDGTEVEFIMDDSEDEAPVTKKGFTEPQRQRTELEAACYTYLKSLSSHDFALLSKFGEAEALLKKF